MNATLAEALSLKDKLSDSASKQSVSQPDPVVIIGNGPVGMRAASELLRADSSISVVIFGEEPHLPYNRVKLSSWLAGDVAWNDLLQPLRRPFGTKYEERVGYRVEHIDTVAHTVTDQTGAVQAYSKLILAVGSRAFVPPIPGIESQGVYTLRNMKDANSLLARRVRSHHTVVVGGGLLGLESARAMQPFNTQVTVVEHADRLMAHQLDEASAELLKDKVESMGMDIVLGDGIQSIVAEPRVTAIRLHSGRTIECDTVIVATGIRANTDLAKIGGFAFGNGIKVNDQMQTSIDDVYAIGECAEHRGEVYGLVAPGLEQASVAVSHITGEKGRYTGSIASSRLKVVGTQVFSMGPMGASSNPRDGRKYVYKNGEGDEYRALLVRHNRLAGAIGMGEWPETVRLQSAISDEKKIYPWNVWRFQRSGQVWPEAQGGTIAAWPASATVCQCMGVSRGRLSEAIGQGANSVDALRETTGASSVCGSCKPLVADLLGSDTKRESTKYATALLFISLLTLAMMSVVAFFPSLTYSTSVEPVNLAGLTLDRHWDVLWRDGFYKQVSGFTVLGISVLAIVLSLRKRIPGLRDIGQFATWRLIHIALGCLALGILMVHTGFRLGYGLNQFLMIAFLGLILLGSLASAVLAYEHKMSVSLANAVRRQAIWLHIFLFWPVPLLLGWHVFKGYWY